MLERRESSAATATYVLRVEQVYKGEIGSRIEVVTPSNGAACGLEAAPGQRVGLLLEREGSTWQSGLCFQVDPAQFLELTDVEDNALPAINWGGYVVGFALLALVALLLVRRRRRYSAR